MIQDKASREQSKINGRCEGARGRGSRKRGEALFNFLGKFAFAHRQDFHGSEQARGNTVADHRDGDQGIEAVNSFCD